MATKKVRIYKSQDGKGAYINNTAKFLNKALPKAKYGRSKNYSLSDVMDTIFDEVALENTEDDVVDTLQQQYGMSYNDAMDAIDAYKDVLEVQKTKDEEVVDLLPETDDNFGERYNYNLNEKWASEGNDDSWEDEEVDDLEDTGNELKRGGSISRSKFVKKVVKGLKKANEGLEQTNSNTGNILDTPINGRESFLNNFKRGVKDLGNEFYAKKIYDQTKNFNPAMNAGMPMAQDGMEMQDVENPMHHLQAYGDTTSEIFQKPMNQVHGAGYEIPQARRGREQRQQRQMNKDWNKMFGNIAAGNISLPGLPSYIGTISPQIIQAQPGTNQGAAGPLMDVQFKKGPWWKGTREWSIKGMPVQPMMGRSMGVMPGYGYMPSNYGYGSSWSRSYTYPGKVISQVASAVNAAADPGKNADAAKLKNNPIATSGSYGPGYEGFNADANGNGIADYLEVVSTPVKTAVEQPEVSVAPQVMTPDRLSEIEREYGDIQNERSFFPTPQYYDEFMSTNPTNEDIDREMMENQQKYINYENVRSNPMMLGASYDNGGFVDSSNPDLYKFIYGGGEPEDISNVVYYDDNDIDTKNVEDPYFSHGGLHKADGGWQVTDPNNRIKTQAPNQYQSPAYKQYNPNATAQSNYNSFMELQRRGLSEGQYNPSKSYDTSNTSGRIMDMRNSGNQGGYRVGDQVIYNQGQDNYGGGYPGGYMMNRPSTLKQFVNMFNPIQKDGVWLSQTGPARTMSGQPYNPRVNQMATAGYTDAAGNVVKPRAGYVQDYEVQKGPWYTGGKTTMKVTNRWNDPNAGNYLGPVDPNAKPVQPSATNKPTTAQQPAQQPTQQNTERKPSGMTVTKADGNQIKGVNEKGELVSQQLESSRRKFRDRNAEKQYGGDTESYPDLYEFQGVNNSQVGFSGMGPFDPNANNTGGIGEGKVGPCNEDEVVNPNSPCYDPSYKPGDFTTEYKANQARTFKPKKLSNLFKAAGAGTRNISGIANNLNADSNLAANTTSDNRTGTNYLDYSGGYSGQTQRIMSKTQGAGATGFNSVVGNAAFVKKGGQIEYKEGGVYDLSQEEIGKILAAGGQIKFL